MSPSRGHAADDHKSALFIHPLALRYDFGPQHPLRPLRLRALLDLIRTLDPDASWGEVLEPPPASRAQLLLAHSAEYVDAVQRIDAALSAGERVPQADLFEYGLAPGDTPAFAGMHEASAAIAGATRAAVRAVLEGEVRHAFSPGGGLHHAMAGHASGFCIYNDVVVGIAGALAGQELRVLYLDFDAHHGDGVQAAFYADPRVLTVSFHETGRYLFPGTGGVDERGRGAGAGYSVNLPFSPFTEDDSWLEAVEALLPRLFARFQPQLVVSQHGADGHAWDPLTHLLLTSAAFRRQTALVHELAHRYCAGRWVACGGGGYDPVRVVPRAWTALWIEMCGRALPDALPAAWLQRWQGEAGGGAIPETFDDPPDAAPEIPRREAIAAENRRTLERVLELIG